MAVHLAEEDLQRKIIAAEHAQRAAQQVREQVEAEAAAYDNAAYAAAVYPPDRTQMAYAQSDYAIAREVQ